MKIQKGPELRDQEAYSPQDLFYDIRRIGTDSSEKSLIKVKARKADLFTNYDTFCKDNEYTENKTQKKSRNFMGLKKIIQDQKIKSLIRNFVSKLKRNNISGIPIQYQPFEVEQKSWFEKDGFSFHPYFETIWNLGSIVQMLLMTILYTLSLVFDEVANSQILEEFQIYTIFFYLAELTISFVTVKSVEGRKLQTMKEISYHYLKGRFALDLVILLILILDIIIQHQALVFIRLIMILKIPEVVQKMVKLENIFIDNFYKEQYWGLIKVFMLNFGFAHFLAVALVAMARIDPENNWITQKEWNTSPWYEIYVWAYYWGTTIMLTVGFGDLSATNFQQALCLTLIETVSCIALAYNINCVGNLINNIRSQDIEKNRNQKVFNKLSQKNDIPDQLGWRINNYIEESTNIKKKFNFQEENSFVSKLPPGLKADFLKESNKKIFQNLIFFKNLTEKTLLGFAQKIQMRICHPEEVIRRKDGQFNVYILKEGHIGFVCKKNNFDFNDTLIDEVKVYEDDPPFLLSLDFITKEKKQFQMKSLQYSSLYCLSYQTSIAILQGSEMDYEHFCQLRDKSRHIVDEYEVFTCTLCGKYHMKFDCPKIHYIPLEQHIIFKHLYQMKRQKTSRISYKRCKKAFSTLRMVRRVCKDIQMREEPKNFDMKNFKRGGLINTKKKTLASKGMLNFKTCAEEFENSIYNEMQINTQQAALSKNIQIVIEKLGQKVIEDVSKTVSAQKAPEIWIIESDEAKNYKFYFNQNNPNQLRSFLGK